MLPSPDNSINNNNFEIESYDSDKSEKNDNLLMGVNFNENNDDERFPGLFNASLLPFSTAFKSDIPNQNQQNISEINNNLFETFKNDFNKGEEQKNISKEIKEDEIKQEIIEKEEKKEKSIKKDKEDEKEEDKKEEDNNGELKEILIEENNQKLPPNQILFEDIKNKYFSKININNLIKEKFVKTDNLSDLQNKMSDKEFLAPKKRNRDKPNDDIREAKKSGRKKKDDTANDSLHNKDSQDNIIKKIKSKIITNLLIFINSILNSFLSPDKIKSYIRIIKKLPEDKEPEYEDLLKDLDYNKTVNETKKERNLDFLKMLIKDFLSIDISPKFSCYSPNSNKIVIDEILKNEKNNKIIMFLLNDLTLSDYIDIFLYKKELRGFGKLDELTINLIMTKFTRVDKLLEEIYKLNNKNNYFSIFISIMYNFERWYFIKKERARTNKGNEKKEK